MELSLCEPFQAWDGAPDARVNLSPAELGDVPYDREHGLLKHMSYVSADPEATQNGGLTRRSERAAPYQPHRLSCPLPYLSPNSALGWYGYARFSPLRLCESHKAVDLQHRRNGFWFAGSATLVIAHSLDPRVRRLPAPGAATSRNCLKLGGAPGPPRVVSIYA